MNHIVVQKTVKKEEVIQSGTLKEDKPIPQSP